MKRQNWLLTAGICFVLSIVCGLFLISVSWLFVGSGGLAITFALGFGGLAVIAAMLGVLQQSDQ